MSESYGEHGHEDTESGVDTIADGGYSAADFEADFSDDVQDEEAVEEEEADSSDSDDEPRSKGHARTARAAKPAAARPKAGAQFGWSDVESILNFVTTFDSGTEKERAALKAVFGVPAKADAFATAQVLHGGGANLAVYKEAVSFVETSIKGGFNGITAIFGLISDLGKREDDFVRDFIRAVNAFLPEEDGVRYRKNAPLPTLLEPLILNSQKNLSDADQKTIKWIDSILAVWPK